MIKFCFRIIIFVLFLLLIGIPAIILIFSEDVFNEDNLKNTNCEIIGYKLIEGCNCNGTIITTDECFENCNFSCTQCFTGEIIVGNDDETDTFTADPEDFGNNLDNLDEIIECYFYFDDKSDIKFYKEDKNILIFSIILLSILVIAIPIYIILEITKFAICCCK